MLYNRCGNTHNFFAYSYFYLAGKTCFIAIDGYQDTKNINKRLINEIKIEKYVRNLGNKNFRI